MDYRLGRDLSSNWTCATAKPITDQAREDFSVAWNVSVSEQLQIEEILRSWTFDLMGTDCVGGDFDVSRWLYDWQHRED